MSDNSTTEDTIVLKYAYGCYACGRRGFGGEGAWGVIRFPDGELNWIFMDHRWCPAHDPVWFRQFDEFQWAYLDHTLPTPWIVPIARLRSSREDPFVTFVRETLETVNVG